MSKFRPLGDRVLVLPDSVAPKVGGLAVPGSLQEKPTQGVVVAVGPHANQGYVGPAQCLNVGDRVQFGKYSGREAMHEGREHKLLRLEECEGVIEDE